MSNHFDQKKKAEEDRKKKEREEKVRQFELNGTIKELLKVKAGRDYVLHLLGKAGIFRTTMTGNSMTYFNEGMRAFGLQMIDELSKAAPEEVPKLFGEYYERRNNSDRTD